jgi:hypothetical protein
MTHKTVPGDRATFENLLMDHLSKNRGPGEFDRPADFWLDKLDDGRYELSRIEDAWLGWRLAHDAAPQPTLAAPLSGLIERLRDTYEGCPIQVTTAPVSLLRDAVAALGEQGDAVALLRLLVSIWNVWDEDSMEEAMQQACAYLNALPDSDQLTA